MASVLAGASAPVVDPDAWRVAQSMRPLRIVAALIAGVTIVVLMGVANHRLHEPTQSELDVVAATMPRHPAPWAPSYQAEQRVLGAIDFQAVHEQLLPDWFEALQHEPYGMGRAREERTFEQLVEAVGGDRNLQGLLRDLRDFCTDDVSVYAREIAALLEGWNDYMHDQGLRWTLAYDIVRTARGGKLFVRSYEVVADVTVHVGSQVQPVQLLARADSSPVGELFFGHTSKDGRSALVVSDRVAEFAIERLWPMMDPQGDALLEPLDQAFAPHLRHEAQRMLSEDACVVLRESAAVRRSLQERLDAIGARRDCGAGIEVENLPWYGLTPRGKAIASRAAVLNQRSRCARLTTHDAEALLAGSERLAGDAKLPEALGELAAWLARAVSVHEARHLADGILEGAGVVGAACVGCPRTTVAKVRAEMSAYVASMATPGVGYLSLYQACGLDVGAMDANAAALRHLLDVIVPGGCEAGPPAELYAVAGDLQQALFRRNDAIRVGEAFPASLPLPPVRIESDPGERWPARGMPLDVASARPGGLPLRSVL